MYVINISGKFLRSLQLLIAFTALSAAAQETNPPPTIGFGEGWRYWNRETAPMSGWKSLEYNDSFWTLGTAQLGYGDGDEATVTRLNPPPHPATAYFRKLFYLANPGEFSRAQIRLIRDDGAVVYINGVEVVRDAMPGGEVGHNTLAALSAGDDEAWTHIADISNFLRHTNVIAVEVHQVSPSSTDMSFDLELRLSELPVEERAVVSIAATMAYTSEPLPNALVVPGQFTVFRADPHLDQPLNVYLTYSGTAGSADYEPLPISVLFPAGSNTVKIPVLAKTDGLVEGPESVIARFSAMPVEIHDPTSPNRPYIQNFTNYVAQIKIEDADTKPLPLIVLSEPRDGEVYPLGAPILLSANATSPVGYIPQVDFYAGTNRIATSILRPELGSPVFHMFVWTNAPAGSHVLTAVGILNSGAVVRSEPVYIKVGPVSERPSIAIEAVNNLTSELNGASDAGKFRVRRVTGPTNEPVLFSMHISGLAVNGIDYETVPSVATIPSGAASVELFVRGLGDNLREGLETAEFRLNEPGCGTGSFPGCYTIFGEGAVQIHIMDGPLTTNEAPNAIITFPAPDSVYEEHQLIEFRAEGVDIEGQVVRMDLLWGNQMFATTNGSVIVARTNFPPGEHHIRARAHDNTGKVGESLAVRIFVNGTSVSNIRINQPQDGAVFQVGQPIRISATAIDPNGYIPRLEFFANHLRIGVSELHFLVAPPPGTPIQHSIIWSNAPMGSYAVAAFGTDSQNQYISSPPINIVVTNTPWPGPVVGVITRLSDYPVSSGFEIATGMFEFYRSGPTNEALQVFFDKGGSATPGADYVSFNNYIVFAPGSTRTNIVVSALDDSFNEGVETVVVDLKPAPLGIDSQFPTHYVIDPTNELATLAILDDESINSEPRVVITRPANGSNFRIGVPISIEAATVDPAGYIPVVDFFAGDNLIGTSRIDFIVPPPPGTRIVHTGVWSNAPAGTHNIIARGQSNRRFTVESEPIRITVGASDHLTIGVEAMDPVGWEAFTNGFPDNAQFRISRLSGLISRPVTVYFNFAGSALYGTDYHPIPKSVTFSSNEFTKIVTIAPIPDNLLEGNESVVMSLTNCQIIDPISLDPILPFPDCYQIDPLRSRAEVTIRDGSFPSNQPPRVTITAPHDGAVFEQGERVHYRVEASDPDGRVVQINMLMDGRVIASTNSGGVMVNSTNPPVGEHTLLAIARDDDGATNVSQRVRILVRGTNDLAFFERQLPAGFTPSTPFAVRILARVPSGTQAWGVEDQPPQGWTVSSISDGGTFDSATGKVKFGHFLEPGTRTLSYVVRPPLGAIGTVEFTGIGSLDGRIYPIRGQNTISTLASEFHPADRNEDRRIALAEVTGYAAVWKLGEIWPAGPNPIPASYVTRAGLIWRQGEAYRFITTNPPPACWTPLAAREGVFLAASASTATRSISGGTEPSDPRLVTLQVEPAASVTAYNVEERVPEGWTVQNITADGVLDPVRRVVRWGLYLDSEERTLSYQLVPPDGVAAGGQLLGEVTLDGEVLTFAGADSVVSVDPATQLRLQSTQLTGDGGVRLKLGGAASQICILESSSDLVNWGFVAELFLPNGELEFRDSDVGETQQRYYRLRTSQIVRLN